MIDCLLLWIWGITVCVVWTACTRTAAQIRSTPSRTLRSDLYGIPTLCTLVYWGIRYLLPAWGILGGPTT